MSEVPTTARRFGVGLGLIAAFAAGAGTHFNQGAIAFVLSLAIVALLVFQLALLLVLGDTEQRRAAAAAALVYVSEVSGVSVEELLDGPTAEVRPLRAAPE
jgi:FtsH-binding integral membrane protein